MPCCGRQASSASMFQSPYAQTGNTCRKGSGIRPQSRLQDDVSGLQMNIVVSYESAYKD